MDFLYCREIEVCNELLASLCSGFVQALQLKAKCKSGQLIPDGEHTAIGLFNMTKVIDQNPFYGRGVGFHVSFYFLRGLRE